MSCRERGDFEKCESLLYSEERTLVSESESLVSRDLPTAHAHICASFPRFSGVFQI